MVQVVSSLLQWEPANVVVDSSSRFVKCLHVAVLYITTYMYLIYVTVNDFSVVESFEVVVSIYAQQLSQNESQTFTVPSLTLFAELVNT